MSKIKRNRAKGQLENPRSRRKIFIIAGIIISLLLTSGALAQWTGIISVTNKSNGALAPPIYDPTAPTTEYIYFNGRLIATEEPTPLSPLSPPGNLLATVSNLTSSQINLQWSASPDPPGTVDHYQVERSANFSTPGTQGFTFVANVSGTSFTDTPPSSGVVAYLYRVRAANAANTNFSTYSNSDLATTVIFTDVSLTNQLIKAVHLTQLRDTVNAVRALANPSTFPPVGWTDPAPLGFQVKAQHMQQLRDNLNPALTALGLATVPPDASIAMGNSIKAVHLQDVRQKVQ